MNSGQDRKFTRRSLVTSAVAAGVAASTLSLGRAGAAPARKFGKAPVFQDKPFAGKKITVFGPSYHAPYFPEQIIPLFTEKTGAEVEFLQFPGGEEGVKYAAYIVAQDGSSDLLYTWETDVAQFGTQLFEDITGKVNQAVTDDIVPAAQAAMLWQGKQYGVPFDSNMSVFMWNTELYEAAGLDPNTPPANWAEYIEFSKKLTGGETFATNYPPSLFAYSVLMNSTGGTTLSDDLKTVQADTAEGKATLQAISDMFTAGVVDPTSLSLPDSIEQGKSFRSGRFAHYAAFPNHFKLANDPTQSSIVGKAKTGINPGITLRSGTANGIEGYSINKFSENKELALAFLEFTMSPEAQNIVATVWGRPPASKTTLSDPAVLEVAPQFGTVLEQSQYVAKRYGSPFYTDLDKLYVDEILKLAKGEATVDETATAIQTAGQKIVDDYWAKVG
jgi:multiple sugar transport system substrate-binding protein